jgi:hypothetical protein
MLALRVDGAAKPAHIVTPSTTVGKLLDMSALAIA